MAVDNAFVPKSVVFSSTDASEVPWGVREFAMVVDWISSPLLKVTVAFEIIAVGTVVWKLFNSSII